jgi:hypothetical protein
MRYGLLRKRELAGLEIGLTALNKDWGKLRGARLARAYSQESRFAMRPAVANGMTIRVDASEADLGGILQVF